MFKDRAASHLVHHHPELAAKNVFTHFERGPVDTHARPGGQTQAYGRVRVGKGTKCRVARPGSGSEHDIEMIDDDILEL